MKKLFKYPLIFATLFFTLPALAQTTADKATTQLKRLLQLNGSWQAPEAILQTGGKEYKFIYYADFKKIANNYGLAMNEWANIPGMGRLNGANLIGIDLYEGKIHWYSVDNLGTTHEHIGEFTDDKHFTMMYQDMRDGKEYIEMITLVLNGSDKMNFKLTATLDGKAEEVITGVFQRKVIKGFE